MANPRDILGCRLAATLATLLAAAGCARTPKAVPHQQAEAVHIGASKSDAGVPGGEEELLKPKIFKAPGRCEMIGYVGQGNGELVLAGMTSDSSGYGPAVWLFDGGLREIDLGLKPNTSLLGFATMADGSSYLAVRDDHGAVETKHAVVKATAGGELLATIPFTREILDQSAVEVGGGGQALYVLGVDKGGDRVDGVVTEVRDGEIVRDWEIGNIRGGAKIIDAKSVLRGGESVRVASVFVKAPKETRKYVLLRGSVEARSNGRQFVAAARFSDPRRPIVEVREVRDNRTTELLFDLPGEESLVSLLHVDSRVVVVSLAEFVPKDWRKTTFVVREVPSGKEVLRWETPKHLYVQAPQAAIHEGDLAIFYTGSFGGACDIEMVRLKLSEDRPTETPR